MIEARAVGGRPGWRAPGLIQALAWRRRWNLRMSTSLKRMAVRRLRALDSLGLRSRVVDHRRMQAVVVVELMIGVGYLLLMMVFSAVHPTVAVGIVFQTVAGVLATPQFWANSATDSVVGRAARQIEKSRFGIIGLFNGSPRSLVITLCWCCTGAFCAGAVPTPADGILDWMFVGFAVIAVSSGLLAFVLALLAVSARTLLIGLATPPDGVVLRTFGGWLAARAWVGPVLGLLFVAGGALQLTAN
jgi:hypothetical protein